MKLKDFVKKYRKEWDDKKAPDDLWFQINEELDTDNNLFNKSWFKVIALLAIITIILILHSIILKKDTTTKLEPTQDFIEYAALEEYEEAQFYYLTSIDLKEKKLNEYSIDATLKRDLALLDESFEELEKEFKNTQGIYKEEVLKAMIQNHRTKLSILETVLYNYQNINQKSNEALY